MTIISNFCVGLSLPKHIAEANKAKQYFRTTPSTEKFKWLYVDYHKIGKFNGIGVNSGKGFFIQEIKLASTLAANKCIF